MSRADEITPEVPRTSTPRRVALFVVGLVACFALLNVGARWYLSEHGTNLGYRIVHAKWDLLESMDDPVDWLVLGDSSGCHGVVPEILSEELGGTAVNLATLANLLIAEDAWMLQRYIERFGPPRNVVLVHTFDLWPRGYRSALIGQIPQPWGFWERLEPTIDFTSGQARRVFLSRYLPLYAENKTLRSHLENLGPTPELAFFEMSPTGFIPARDHRPASFAKDLRRTRRFLAKNRTFTMSRLNREGLEVIGELSQKHGFPVYLVNGPSHDATVASPAHQSYIEQRDRALDRRLSRYPRFRALPAQPTYAAKQLEVCIDHVIPEVAPDYTRALADILRRAGAVEGG